jgi:glycine cleavage system H lipoate-binding protein
MFPWVYGFTWNAGTVIFLGFFFAVIVVMSVTVAKAALRAYRERGKSAEDRIRWHEDFRDLPAVARTCRHVFTGEYQERICEREFDCRACPDHEDLTQLSVPRPTALAQTVGSLEIHGLHFPLDRKYHRGHTWVEGSGEGEPAHVGLDDLALRIIGGEGKQFVLPPAGTELRLNGTAFRVIDGAGSEVRVLSPVDGTIVETRNSPSGWLLRIQVKGGRNGLNHLLHGAEVRPWVVHELDRLQRILSRQGGGEIGLTLADGGELMPGELLGSDPRTRWASVAGELLLEI